jgi:hypothetical protein
VKDESVKYSEYQAFLIARHWKKKEIKFDQIILDSIERANVKLRFKTLSELVNYLLSYCLMMLDYKNFSEYVDLIIDKSKFIKYYETLDKKSDKSN